jgi:transposase InsO family protein
MNINYKGLVGKIHFSSRTDTFYGEISNDAALICAQAATLPTTITALKEAVDRYFSYCLRTSTWHSDNTSPPHSKWLTKILPDHLETPLA